MYNKSGGKVRLTFKLEQDQLWIGTKGEMTPWFSWIVYKEKVLWHSPLSVYILSYRENRENPNGLHQTCGD